MRDLLDELLGRVVVECARHAGVRRQPDRLQGAQRGRAARRGARRRVHGSAGRRAHRPRAGAARDDRSRRLGRPQGDRRQPVREHATTRRTTAFALPAYMQRGIERGHLGRKTRDKGGFFRVDGKGAERALRARSGDRRLPAARRGHAADAAFVEQMKAAHPRSAATPSAIDVLCRRRAARTPSCCAASCSATSATRSAASARSSSSARDVDRIMGFGFNWAPPSVLVDCDRRARTIGARRAARLPVPTRARRRRRRAHATRLFDAAARSDIGRIFAG